MSDAFISGARFAEVMAPEATGAPTTGAGDVVPLSDAMLVVLSLLGLYFFVAMVELCLMASKQVNEIKAAANFGSGGDSDASKGLIETKAEEAEKAKGFMDMVEDLNKKLELSVHEVPMIAVLVFFAHVRVRNDLGFTLETGAYPEAMIMCYWLCSAVVFVKATLAFIGMCVELCLKSVETAKKIVKLTSLVLAFLAEIALFFGVGYLVVLIVTTPKYSAQ